VEARVAAGLLRREYNFVGSMLLVDPRNDERLLDEVDNLYDGCDDRRRWLYRVRSFLALGSHGLRSGTLAGVDSWLVGLIGLPNSTQCSTAEVLEGSEGLEVVLVRVEGSTVAVGEC
jgi:hypothetical protein